MWLGSKLILPSKVKNPNLKPQALKGFKTVKMLQERRLISGTALLQPLEFILSHTSTHPSIFHMQRSLMHTVPSFFLPCYFSSAPTTQLSLHCLRDSSPPSILVSKHLFLPLVLFLFFTVIFLSSVRPSVSLFVLLPSSLSEVREGASVPGEMLFVFGGRGEGLHRIRGEGSRSGKGMKGRMGRA